jgi:hypothetical protein
MLPINPEPPLPVNPDPTLPVNPGPPEPENPIDPVKPRSPCGGTRAQPAPLYLQVLVPREYTSSRVGDDGKFNDIIFLLVLCII